MVKTGGHVSKPGYDALHKSPTCKENPMSRIGIRGADRCFVITGMTSRVWVTFANQGHRMSLGKVDCFMEQCTLPRRYRSSNN